MYTNADLLRIPVTNVFKEVITPERAKRDLANWRANRPLNKNRVAMYARVMKEGKWVADAADSPIAYDKDGRGVNGEHRMTGCVQSNASFVNEVRYGLSEEAIAILDHARPRRIADTLKITYNLDNAHKLKPMITTVDRLINGYDTMLTEPELLELYSGSLKESFDWVQSNVKGKIAAPITGAIAFAYAKDPVKVQEFAARFSTGLHIEDGDPAGALRRLIIERKAMTKARENPTAISRKTLWAIKQAIEGNTATKIIDGGRAAVDFFNVFEFQISPKAHL